MTFTHDEFNYLLRFEKGEQILAGLKDFVRAQNLRGGWIMGIGGLAWAELGFYDLNTQEYRWRKLTLALELISLSGNIAWQDGEPVLHLHASVSDAGLQMYGGHLKEAETSGTVEVFIHMWDVQEGLTRSRDEQTGLNLLQL